jgi:hypothetical protein
MDLRAEILDKLANEDLVALLEAGPEKIFTAIEEEVFSRMAKGQIEETKAGQPGKKRTMNAAVRKKSQPLRNGAGRITTNSAKSGSNLHTEA